MTLYLAPMEGVVDWIMRDLMTQIGGVDVCTTEFIRVSSRLLPDRVFYRYCPELQTQGKTHHGVPVLIQLLGGDPVALAENAAFAAQLGAPGIDLNFGCPAKTVNRHDGGATLLKYPDRLLKIVESVRRAVPEHIPVSAKIRLGFDNPAMCTVNAQAAQAGGAARLTVHCRTKTDGYRPPAFWEWIPKIKDVLHIPVVANGEIWTVQDFENCREQTGCDQIMIGRGAIANPFLFRAILGHKPATWTEMQSLLSHFFHLNQKAKSPYFAQARTKQWLRQLARTYPQASAGFERLKVITQPETFYQELSAL